ncbi:hypothetical protein [Candidatus Schmidhempelia bombi]|uniref:hypothetical protein n=1 Tax=Candidatus Schmidhempelia bombi TaxID=1505866 RepID=UPI001EE8DFDB|nr:hypothetical protein [Candidatus Schmidhempelia bombi]
MNRDTTCNDAPLFNNEKVNINILLNMLFEMNGSFTFVVMGMALNPDEQLTFLYQLRHSLSKNSIEQKLKNRNS